MSPLVDLKLKKQLPKQFWNHYPLDSGCMLKVYKILRRHPGHLLNFLNVPSIYVLYPGNMPFSKITFGYTAAIEFLAFNLVVCSPSTYKNNFHLTSDIEILLLNFAKATEILK